jgi:PKHD-type hydroxylase
MDLYISPNLIPNLLCDTILWKAHHHHIPMAGLIGSANRGSLRSSEVRWLRRGELWDDLFNLIEQTVAQVGWEIFEMKDLVLEPIQFTTYMPGCYYDWHSDWSKKNERRLSFSIQLDDLDDYAGGDLRFEEVPMKDAQRLKGTFFLFRSEILHQVTPITKGNRNSLVGWFK